MNATLPNAALALAVLAGLGHSSTALRQEPSPSTAASAAPVERVDRGVAFGTRGDGESLTSSQHLIVGQFTEAMRWLERRTGRRFARPLEVHFPAWSQWTAAIDRIFVGAEDPSLMHAIVFHVFDEEAGRMLVSAGIHEVSETEIRGEYTEHPTSWLEEQAVQSVELCAPLLAEDAFGLTTRFHAASEGDEKRVLRALREGFGHLMAEQFATELGYDGLVGGGEQRDLRGRHFLKRCLRAGGLEAVDAALAGPPPTWADFRSAGRRDPDREDGAAPFDTNAAFRRESAADVWRELAVVRGEAASDAAIDPPAIVELESNEYDAAWLAAREAALGESHVEHSFSVLHALGVVHLDVARAVAANEIDARLAKSSAFHDVVNGRVVARAGGAEEAPFIERLMAAVVGEVGEEDDGDDIVVLPSRHRAHERDLAPALARWTSASHIADATGDATAATTDARLVRRAAIDGHATAAVGEWRFGSAAAPYHASAASIDDQRLADGSLRALRLTAEERLAAQLADHSGQSTRGASFVQTLVRAGGWSAANAVCTELPLSMEQVLHPAKFTADWPVTLEFDVPSELLAAGWTVVARDTLGEAFLHDVVATNGNEHDAALASIGWDGDTFVLLGRDGELAALWALAFDRDVDAAQAARALERVCDGYRPRPMSVDVAPTPAALIVDVGSEGRRVACVVGLDEALTAVAKTALAAATVRHHASDTRQGADDGATTAVIERERSFAFGGPRTVVERSLVRIPDVGLVFTMPSVRWKLDRFGDARVRVERDGDSDVEVTIEVELGRALDLADLQRRERTGAIAQGVLEEQFQSDTLSRHGEVEAWIRRVHVADEGGEATVRHLGFVQGGVTIVVEAVVRGSDDDGAIEREIDALFASIRFEAPSDEE